MDYQAEELESVRCNLCGAREAREILRMEPFAYVRCGRCGLVYLNPRLRDLRGWHRRRYREGRDGDGPEGDIARQFSPRRMARLAREARRYGKYRRFNRLLDVGCSAGAFLEAARGEGWVATGVDVADLRLRAGGERKGVRFLRATLREAAFPDDHFDVVRINNVLEHVPDPLSDLREAWRILRENGLLSMATINGRSFASLLGGRNWRYYDPLCHVYVFTPETLRRMLRRAGFRRISMDTHGFRRGRAPAGGSRRGLERTLAFAARLLGRGHRIRATAKKIPFPSRSIVPD